MTYNICHLQIGTQEAMRQLTMKKLVMGIRFWYSIMVRVLKRKF